MLPSSKRKEPPTPAAQSRKKQWRTPKQHQLVNKALTIRPGDAGIWATCDMHKEGKATAELQDLFEDYATRIYGENCLNVQRTDSNAAGTQDGADDDGKVDHEGNDRSPEALERAVTLDIEAEIANELQGMKKVRTAQVDSNSQPLFQAVRLDVQCVLFFKTRTPVEPVSFVERICRDARQGRVPRRSRCVRRLTPMTRMGKADWAGLEGVAKGLLEDVFHGEGVKSKKFAIRPTIRNHSIMKRDDVIKNIAFFVGPNHTVDLKNYDHMILVDIYQNILGVSVVDGDYEDLKRFNLAEIYEPTPQTPDQKSGIPMTSGFPPETCQVENARPATTSTKQDVADNEEPSPTTDMVTNALQSTDAESHQAKCDGVDILK